MSGDAAFDVEPWGIGIHAYDPELTGRIESLLAVSNGFIGWRATLDEEPSSTGDTCRLNGFFESFPISYAEPAYGYPRFGQALAGVADGTMIRLLVDGEPLELSRGRVLRHEQRLDLRAGTLHRLTEWESPSGARVRVASTRQVSLTRTHVAAVRYVVEALDAPHNVSIVSGLDVPTQPPEPPLGVRAGAPLEAVEVLPAASGGTLVHRAAGSGLTVAVAVHHEHDGFDRPRIRSGPGGIDTVTSGTATPGEPLTLDKFVAYDWTARTEPAAARRTVGSALAEARELGWAGLLAEQRDALDAYWERVDVELDGDARLQQAVRLALFHVLQATACADEHPSPAKGLTGGGYHGHTFWDLEGFLLPTLVFLRPEAAGAALRWRHATLPLAQDRARELGLGGAAFPWRTVDGHECSGYWPAGTAALHLDADIADAVLRYLAVNDDPAFEASPAVELLVETARLWCALGRWDDAGGFHLDGVTGPDEYSALSDDNVYTNLMAQQNLTAAADLAERHQEAAARLHVDEAERTRWRRAADAMAIPYDEQAGVHPQSAGFTRKAPWDFERTADDDYPLVQHRPYFELYRHQVTKQADLVLALLRRPDVFTPEQRARDFAYYEAITVRDSSLSASSQAVVAAEVGHPSLALAYVRETALIDLDDLHRDADDGVHLAAAAGLWTALTAGLAGMRLRPGRLAFAPRLPAGLRRLTVRVPYRGRLLVVELGPADARYRLADGEELTITHFDREVTVGCGPVSVPIPPAPDAGPAPGQPPHRPPALGR